MYRTIGCSHTVGSFEVENETSSSIKIVEFFDRNLLLQSDPIPMIQLQ